MGHHAIFASNSSNQTLFYDTAGPSVIHHCLNSWNGGALTFSPPWESKVKAGKAVWWPPRWLLWGGRDTGSPGTLMTFTASLLRFLTFPSNGPVIIYTRRRNKDEPGLQIMATVRIRLHPTSLEIRSCVRKDGEVSKRKALINHKKPFRQTRAVTKLKNISLCKSIYDATCLRRTLDWPNCSLFAHSVWRFLLWLNTCQ